MPGDSVLPRIAAIEEDMSVLRQHSARHLGGGFADSPFYRPSGFESATSWVHGVDTLPPIPHIDATAREAFEAAIRPALARSPCFVSFSGGRDSSAVLAVATFVARREGFDDPVPVTEIYPEIDESDESEWQSLVIDHLGLSEWVRIPIRNENDLLGEPARAGLLRRGLVWPPTLQIKDALLATASGGSMLTGEGGDETIGPRRVTPLTLLMRKRRRPTRELLTACASAAAPRALRRAQLRSGLARDDWQPWLLPQVAREHHRLMAEEEASEPMSWGRSAWWVSHRRAVAVVLANYDAIAAEHQVKLHHPLLDEGFVAALARAGGWWGYSGRTALMRMLFSDVLPDEILRRSSKASFDRAYMGEATREFARSWDGSGVDPELVDPEILRRSWCSDQPSTSSGMLLQSAWLSGQPASAVPVRPSGDRV